MSGTAFASVGGVDCLTGDACLYYNSGFGGARWTYPGDVPNLQGERFYAWKTYNGTVDSAGDAQPVKNNTASAQNWSNTQGFRIYYNSNYGGVYQTFDAGMQGNLNSSLKNEDASIKWFQEF
ncbi:peptidase inhibitor family I36 protein [Streptacidiphilus cavernicola]|uniref:Peptidase inhibitor family I36 protein n=1 Tax=Streptacidiphilus cavernicola TaxID=3342716 RepID=A0ABV6VTW5_9ACTN